jgi:hypothetical protein
MEVLEGPASGLHLPVSGTYIGRVVVVGECARLEVELKAALAQAKRQFGVLKGRIRKLLIEAAVSQ